MSVASLPSRYLSAQEVETYRRDGVVMVSGLIERNWLDLLNQGLAQSRASQTGYGQFMSRKERGFSMTSCL